ncbi:MAG: hypothetical protein GY950_16160, partial [bacterium]|nr:hypothetical protein [bacterium]
VCRYTENLSGVALGATFGLMYKPMDQLSIGLVWKAPVKATINGTAEAPLLSMLGLPGESNADRTATWPMFLGAGIAVKPNDQLTVLVDVTYNNWKKMENIPITFDEAGWQAAGLEEGAEFTLKWKDTFDFKIGVEYKLSNSLALRAGFYTDRSPSEEETLNILLPSIHYKGFTCGVGFKRGKFNVDLAFEYLVGADRDVDPMNYYAGAGMPGTHGMKILVPNFTVTYTFD